MEVAKLVAALPGTAAQGLIWGIMAIGVYITYKILDYADLSVDGSICTGAAVTVMLIMAGLPPWAALALAFGAGMLAGLVTGIFHTLLGIPPILSGILTQLGLYSINLRIMGNRANQSLSVEKFRVLLSARQVSEGDWSIYLTLILFVAVLVAALYWFFGTELGAAIRATGDNPNMARAQGINTGVSKVLGLVLSNGIVALSGGLLAQYQGFSDVNMGRGAIVIGLASVIIGDVLFGRLFRNFALRMFGVVMGAILYYVVIATVLWAKLPPNDLKLFSALVVATFLAMPHLKTARGKRTKREGGGRDA